MEPSKPTVVLFSAIGGHDPVATMHDGPVLHICRHHRPEAVYLYISEEMTQWHEKDDRYRQGLALLGAELGTTFHTHVFQQTEGEIHRFGDMLDQLRPLLMQVRQAHPDAKLLLNISSGSPAIKSALLLLAKLLDVQATPVQVTTPEKRQNFGGVNPRDYQLEDEWALNQDCGGEMPSRCAEENYENFTAQVLKKLVCAHVMAFDYSAAVRIMDGSPTLFSPDCRSLLQAADKRTKLDLRPLTAYARDHGIKATDWIPIQQSGVQLPFEHLLWLKVKKDRGEYAEYIRGITPLLFRLSLVYLQVKCKCNIEDYCDKDDRLLTSKLSKTPEGQEILEKLNTRYFSGFKDSYLSSDICVHLISMLSTDETMKACFSQLRDFELGIRNKVAHDIVVIDEKMIDQKTGYTVEKSFQLLVQAFRGVAPLSKGALSCYDVMNQHIIAATKQEYP